MLQVAALTSAATGMSVQARALVAHKGFVQVKARLQLIRRPLHLQARLQACAALVLVWPGPQQLKLCWHCSPRRSSRGCCGSWTGAPSADKLPASCPQHGATETCLCIQDPSTAQNTASVVPPAVQPDNSSLTPPDTSVKGRSADAVSHARPDLSSEEPSASLRPEADGQTQLSELIAQLPAATEQAEGVSEENPAADVDGSSAASECERASAALQLHNTSDQQQQQQQQGSADPVDAQSVQDLSPAELPDSAPSGKAPAKAQVHNCEDQACCCPGVAVCIC